MTGSISPGPRAAIKAPPFVRTNFGALPTERRESVTQRLAGDHHQAGERLAKLQSEKSRMTRTTQRAKEARRRCIDVREQAEACEYDDEP
jgi:hypothetical protein